MWAGEQMSAAPYRTLTTASEPGEVIALVPVHANQERKFWVWDPAAPHFMFTETVRSRSHAAAAMGATAIKAERIAACDSITGITKFFRVEERIEETPGGARKFLQAVVVE